jgi:hypothetical protein
MAHKISFEVLDSQLELLKTIQSLPNVIKAHLGLLPSSFPNNGTYERILELCETLEWAWKKWVMELLQNTAPLDELMKGIKIATEKDYIDERDW